MERIFAIEVMRDNERESCAYLKRNLTYIHLRCEHDCFILSKTTTHFALLLLKHPTSLREEGNVVLCSSPCF